MVWNKGEDLCSKKCLAQGCLSSAKTTKEYQIGDFGYWNAGPDLAIFIVEVIPLGHAETGAETMASEAGTVRSGLVNEEGEQTENE